MNVEDAEEFTQSLGQIVAGSWRQIAWADRQGIPEALGLTTREWVENRLGGYVRLSIPDRREAVAELVADGMTKHEIGEVLGTSARTARRDAAERTDDRPEIEEIEVDEEDERTDDRPGRRAVLPDDLGERVDEGSLSLDEAERVVRDREKRLSVWRDKVRDALRVLARMANDPVPSDLIAEMTDEEVDVLKSVLNTLRGGTYGFLG